MKNVLVTGAKGFVGKNLKESIAYLKDFKVVEFNKGDNPDLLQRLVLEADVIFHLAGINRPLDPKEFETGNFELTQLIVSHLLKSEKKTPVILSSSTQATLDNAYGKSKKAAEDAVFSYGEKTGTPVYVFRFPNIFGKWSRPNYNSVVATFCHNIARELPIIINDASSVVNLVYIDDVVEKFISILNGHNSSTEKFCEIGPVYTVNLGDLATLIESFKKSRLDKSIPDMSDSFTKKLYSTYLSFIPKDQFSYPLKMHVDHRGSFTEFLRSPERGQVSVNISKPGIVKGNHWHHTKNEKFLVVSGKATISFRLIGSDEITTYHVSGEKLEVVDIPTGYTHDIVNVGDSDLVTIMWANESFDPNRPDTFALPVVKI